VSTKSKDISLAKMTPTVLLPEPGIPISTMLGMFSPIMTFLLMLGHRKNLIPQSCVHIQAAKSTLNLNAIFVEINFSDALKGGHFRQDKEILKNVH
jgi:hypothetical protein